MDDVDRATEQSAPALEADVIAVRQAAARIPVGSPGVCRECDEPSGRLVLGLCAPCRDREARYQKYNGRI